MDLSEIGRGGMDRIDLTQDRDQLRTIVKKPRQAQQKHFARTFEILKTPRV
jgi:hypothetical protein